MAMTTSIEWTNKTWNPTVGCSIVSPGCHHCYAMAMAKRLRAMGRPKYADVVDDDGRWTGKVNLVKSRLAEPLKWRKPAMVFVDSMSDLFHEDVPDEYIDRVFAVMALCQQHTFQVLTKRAQRMRQYFDDFDDNWGDGCWRVTRRETISNTQAQFFRHAATGAGDITWPLPNVWLGVSVEDQKRADERIPHLLRTPAAVRFLSCEPLLGPLDLSAYLPDLDWVIVGGES